MKMYVSKVMVIHSFVPLKMETTKKINVRYENNKSVGRNLIVVFNIN